MQGLTFEQWGILASLLLAAASLLIGAGALYYAWKASRSSEEELELSREKSRRHPKLELSNVSLVDAQEVDDVIRTREAKEKWREALNRAMNEDIEASLLRTLRLLLPPVEGLRRSERRPRGSRKLPKVRGATQWSKFCTMAPTPISS